MISGSQNFLLCRSSSARNNGEVFSFYSERLGFNVTFEAAHDGLYSASSSLAFGIHIPFLLNGYIIRNTES